MESMKPKDLKGFSLLELMMALGILSIGLLFLFSLSISTMKINKYSQNKTAAMQLAQEKMENLKSLSFAELQGTSESGLTTGTVGTLFQRETIVRKLTDYSLAEVTIRVSWPSTANPASLHVTELATSIAG
jgi:prepilin-type N-terminal cleavage/methylation domain-containing protein